MGLKKAENQVKILLADTIMALCRNTLNHHSEISVEGLLGITLDNDEIFLVSIDQTISNPDVPSKKRSLEKDSKQTDESKSKRAKDDEDTEIEDEQQEKKSKRRKRRRSRRRGSNVSGGISSDNEDGSDSARPHSDHDVVSNDASFTDDQTNSGNNSSIRIKSETNEDDDEDLVIVKEELGDETIPSTADFPFMAQSFHNFQHLADSPLNNFQPHSSTQAHSQQSMVPSSQPQPGPSVNPPGGDSRRQETPGSYDNASNDNNDEQAILQSLMEWNKSNYAASTQEGSTGSFGHVPPGGNSCVIYQQNWIAAPANNEDGHTTMLIQPDPPGSSTSANTVDISPVMVIKADPQGGSTSANAEDVRPVMLIKANPQVGSSARKGSDRTCAYCNKRFKSPSDMKRHLIVHTRVKDTDEVCRYCGKHFNCPADMRRHLVVHTQEKGTDRVCRYCGKHFKCPADMRRHLIVHTRDKPRIIKVGSTDDHIFHEATERVCRYCGKQCKNPSDLRRHLPAHTQEKSFTCHLCSRSYGWKSALKSHLMKVHKQELDETKPNVTCADNTK